MHARRTEPRERLVRYGLGVVTARAENSVHPMHAYPATGEETGEGKATGYLSVILNDEPLFKMPVNLVSTAEV